MDFQRNLPLSLVGHWTSGCGLWNASYLCVVNKRRCCECCLNILLGNNLITIYSFLTCLSIPVFDALCIFCDKLECSHSEDVETG